MVIIIRKRPGLNKVIKNNIPSPPKKAREIPPDATNIGPVINPLEIIKSDTIEERLKEGKPTVGAQFNSKKLNLSPQLMRVRQNGIQNIEDIKLALDYLSRLDPRLKLLADTFRRQKIPVKLADQDQTFSCAKVTFHGRIDRSSPDFAREVLVRKGAEPAELLHEIVHSLPLSIINQVVETNLRFPPVEPNMTLFELREAILQHVRLNETLSFGFECLVYEIEENKDIAPIFYSQMMRQLYSAWQGAEKLNRFEAISQTFPYFLPHYEGKEGFFSIYFATIVKVEGRTNLTFEELSQIEELSSGKNPVKNYFDYLQNYLERYARDQKLELPPDYFSFSALVKRTAFNQIRELKDLVKVIDSLFQSLEIIQHQTRAKAIVSLAEVTPPPQKSIAAREKLLASLAKTVFRVLEDPPPNLSIQELLAIVSFARLVPAPEALEITDRLKIYLGVGREDLALTLGLILYEKGFQDLGKSIVLRSLTPELLPKVFEPIVHVMGKAFVIEILEKEERILQSEKKHLAATLSIIGNDHFMWDEPEWERASQALFAHPELFGADAWHELGEWIFKNGAVDSNLEDEELLVLPKAFAEILFKYRSRLQTRIELLSKMMKNTAREKDLKARLTAQWQKILEEKQAGFRAFFNLINLKPDPLAYALIEEQETASLSIFSLKEIEDIFKAWSSSSRKWAITLIQTASPENWKYPEAVLSLLDKTLRYFKNYQGNPAPEENEEDFVPPRYFDLFLRLLQGCFLKLSAGVKPSPEIEAKINAIFEALPENCLKAPIMENSMPIHIKEEELVSLSDVLDEKAIKALRISLWKTALFSEQVQSSSVSATLKFAKALADNTVDILEHAKNADSAKSAIWRMETILFYLAFSFQQALKTKNFDPAKAIQNFLFREVPQKFPPGKAFALPDNESSIIPFFSFQQDRGFWEHLNKIEWFCNLEIERNQIENKKSFAGWLKRIKAELERGGESIEVEALLYYADRFEESKESAPLKELYQLMIRKCLMEPKAGNFQKTLRAIHFSKLSDNLKDDLLFGFIKKAAEKMGVRRGIDLGLLQYLKDWVPWETPFVSLERTAHYPKTEAFLVELLANSNELTSAEQKRDDRLRLCALSVVGAALQRYSAWAAQRFTPDYSLAGKRMRQMEIYEKHGLPAPQQIPAHYSAAESEKFLQQHQAVIQNLLGQNDPAAAEIIMTLLGRVMGSELRKLVGDNSDIRSFSTPVLKKEIYLAWSKTAAFCLQWLESQYRSPQRSAHLQKLEEILFSAGPTQVNRNKTALQMLEWPISREEKRRIFTLVAQNLRFSSYLRKKIEYLRKGSDENAEISYYQLFLSLQFSKHPANVPSDFFLRALEKDPGLFNKYHKFLQTTYTKSFILLSELGTTNSNMSLYQLEDWIRFSNLDRINLLADALIFLKKYVECIEREGYNPDSSTSEYISFYEGIINKHPEEFSPLFKAFFTADWSIENNLELYQEILSSGKWPRLIYKSYENDKTDTLPKIIDEDIQRARRLAGKITQFNLNIQRESGALPGFLEARALLEQDIFLTVFNALEPAQQELFRQKAQANGKTSAEEYFLELGRAAHLEKLMQFASVHPAVPRSYQELFAPFQEDVPPRDPIDVARSIEFTPLPEEAAALEVDIQKPLKEGTIGGIYPAIYQGQNIILKILTDKKLQNLEKSFRITEKVQSYLKSTQFSQPGSHTIDDLLGFYQKSVKEEIDLINDIKNAAALAPILPKGFVIPTFMEEISSPSMIAMHPLYSRRLKELSPHEREEVFRRIDHQLIPKMLLHGVVHYDLHPGNIGLTTEGAIVLYDTGRVVILSKESHKNALDFYQIFSLCKNNPSFTKEAAALLARMGEVRDADAFREIDSLLSQSLNYQNPMEGLEAILPKIADYGFRLADDYLKLIFMYITWNGTKKSFNQQ